MLLLLFFTWQFFETCLIAENKTSPFAINWLSIILMAVFSAVVFFILKNKLAVLNKRSDRHRNELDSIDTKMSGNNFPQPTFQNSNFNDFKKSAERNISDLNSAITSLQSDVAKLDIKLHIKLLIVKMLEFHKIEKD